MKASRKSTVAAVVGCALGAALVQGVHAQAKPPIYYVVEVETTRPDAYANEFAPQAQAIIKAAGGRFLALSTQRFAPSPLKGNSPPLHV